MEFEMDVMDFQYANRFGYIGRGRRYLMPHEKVSGSDLELYQEGICEQEIPRKRVEAVPTATFCVRCQGLLE